MKQRWLQDDLGHAVKQSSPAAADAVSRSNCSATSSTTVETAAPTSKTAKPVSAAAADLNTQIKGGTCKETTCYGDGGRGRKSLILMAVHICTCLKGVR